MEQISRRGGGRRGGPDRAAIRRRFQRDFRTSHRSRSSRPARPTSISSSAPRNRIRRSFTTWSWARESGGPCPMSPETSASSTWKAASILTLTENKKEAAYIDLKGLPAIPNYLDQLEEYDCPSCRTARTSWWRTSARRRSTAASRSDSWPSIRRRRSRSGPTPRPACPSASSRRNGQLPHHRQEPAIR